MAATSKWVRAHSHEARPVTVQAAKGSIYDKVLSTMQKQFQKAFDFEKNEDLQKILNNCDVSTREGAVEATKALESICVATFGAFPVPKYDNITKTVFGKEDGLPCEVTVIAPADQTGPLPGIVHIHGGGMAFFDGKEPFNTAASEKMVAQGKAVFCEVHFTNSMEEAFPRGFNDCVAAIRWFHEHQEKFNLIRGAGVMVTGESGGSNLAAAACLKLKGEGIIACAVLGCPFLKPTMGLKEYEKYSQDEINALYLCDPNQKFAEKLQLATIHLYTDCDEKRKNAFAWPGFATDEMVKGLPPTLFLMDEADAYTAQGVEYYRKLDRNGVTASAVTFAGSAHCMAMMDPLHGEIMETYQVALARTHCKPKAAPIEKASDKKEQN